VIAGTVRSSCVSTEAEVGVCTCGNPVEGVGTTTGDGVIGLSGFNGLAGERAEAELLTCCASRRWARTVAGARPYDGTPALRGASARALAELGWDDVLEALAAHPRIGDRTVPAARRGGTSPAGREAGWSRGEQAGMEEAADETRRAMIDGNLAYEKRFGHVFLICATGRSAAEMLAELEIRLRNDVATERSVVRAELSKIVDLRLAKLVGEL
jgi:2-oxo-4-hydroxy-4-carboxy-5-ureidoimidazoline decarboxylase